MTWGEIQIESLKKMFLNAEDLSIENLSEYRNDKKYKTYLFAMPRACNEAIVYICNLEPIIRKYELSVIEERYNLSELIPDFKCVENIVSPLKWEMETENILKIDKNAGNVIIYYEANPKFITADTQNSETIDINSDCLKYVPLYIAGELYKDDDLTLSTVYMNEFINNIDLITGRVKTVTNNKIVPIYRID